MNTPLGTIALTPAWRQSTVVTLRLPHSDPAQASTIVVKRLDALTPDLRKVYDEERAALVRGFGEGLAIEEESEIPFLGKKCPYIRYSFDMAGERITQAMVVGNGPAGAFSATGGALQRSFKSYWPQLEKAIASFSPESTAS